MDSYLFFSLLFVVAGCRLAEGRKEPRRILPEAGMYRTVLHVASQDYVSGQRPPTPEGVPLNVSVGFVLTAVTDVNKKKGYVEVEGMLTTAWHDGRLENRHPAVAAPSGNFHIRLSPEDVWTPDIELYNSVHPGVEIFNNRPTVMVSGNGDMFVTNKVRTRSTCDIIGQIRSGVFNCTLTFGSWTFSGEDVQVNMNSPPSAILHNFKLTSVWNATSATAWQGSNTYDCCPEEYPWVKFSFLLKKRPRL